ncbi:MAG: ABC transporter permease [Clostridia bacterium]
MGIGNLFGGDPAPCIFLSFSSSSILLLLKISVWGGFSLDWYRVLFHDQQMMGALWNSLKLGISSCLISGVIGTLGAVGMTKGRFRTAGAIESIATLPIMIPEIILGIAFHLFSFVGIPMDAGHRSSATVPFVSPIYSSMCGPAFWESILPSRRQHGIWAQAGAGILGYHPAAHRTGNFVRDVAGLRHVSG